MDDVPHISPFEAIRKVAEDGSEYWSARDLAIPSMVNSGMPFKKLRKPVKIAVKPSLIISLM
jgi:hypothetical protein